MNQRDLVERFGKGATSGQGSNMFIEGDTLYSYGHHFPLVIRLTGGGYLHNGDTYSVTTSGHQSHCRSALSGPQVPFSALNAANVSERDRFGLEIIEEGRDHHDWVCPCPAPKHVGYERDACPDGYERHTLGGTVLRHKRRYLLSAIDFETGLASRPLFFMCLLSGKVGSLAEAYASLEPAPVKIARALGAEIQRQGDFFFVRSTLGTRDLNRNGAKRVEEAVFRGFQRVNVSGFPLDRRESHLATEARKLAGIATKFVRGTVRHVPGEHRMVKLGRSWWGAFQNTARASWAAAGNID